MISIIIPVYNEEKNIAECLQSVLDALTGDVAEIIVVDGRSTDHTRDVIQKMMERHPIIRLMDNPKKTVPHALNMAVRAAKGIYILRLDAHSTYPMDYIRNCMQAMNESGAENVGGVFVTRQNGSSFSARMVQLISTHKFGVGNAQYRLKTSRHYADTVPYGFFKRQVFDKIGYFDERLTRNQDYEFNQRLIKKGGRIWLDPCIKIFYKNQATLTGLFSQGLFTGKWNVWMWRAAPYCFHLRHSIPGVFVSGIIILSMLAFWSNIFKSVLFLILGAYFLAACISSIQQATRYGIIKDAFILPFCFLAYHLSYGLGILHGFAALLSGRSEVGSATRPWAGASDYMAIKSIF